MWSMKKETQQVQQTAGDGEGNNKQGKVQQKETTTTTMNVQQEERKSEEENTTTTKNNNAAQTTTALDQQQQNNPAQQDLKRNQTVKVKGTKKITDMKDLKLFLAKKKLERAQNGNFKDKNQKVAASIAQPINFLLNSAHSDDHEGNNGSQTKPAATGDTDIAAKGDTFSAGTSDWLESTARPDSDQ